MASKYYVHLWSDVQQLYTAVEVNTVTRISEEALRTGLRGFHKSINTITEVIEARGHGGRVVTLSPPTSVAGVRSPEWSQVGKLVVACRWSAVYSTEP